MNMLSFNIRGIRGGVKAQTLREFKRVNNTGIMAIQETKMDVVTVDVIAGIWGNRNFESASVAAEGQYGGLLWIWDPRVLKIDSSYQNRSFLCISGIVVSCGTRINLMNVSAPQSTVAERSLWSDISNIIDSKTGLWVLVGDFNAVRSSEERKQSKFKLVCANNFNEFIFNNGLLEYPMQGRKFTCCRDNGKKLSKLDRFLVCPKFFNKWSTACVKVLPCLVSDHYPILLELVKLLDWSTGFRGNGSGCG
ncbi:uncharacterized protein LOC110902212 [Helianthus annuus]|uniref:uncharacterized protein LOC110902212 n=1 Tax=Helianthus annuus TaxID=4232 RepID=UPI000B8FFF0D|nr:uncharacterized protein LOC110902212 [Helianthus annuus]